MHEILPPRKEAEGASRRWFQDDFFDLYIWQARGGGVSAFQLCYDRRANERSLRWSPATGFAHDGVDIPEDKPGRAMSALLTVDGVFPAELVTKRFAESAKSLPAELREVVAARLSEFAGGARKKSAKPPKTTPARKAPRKRR
jgi:hypothetical protein